MAMQEVTNQHLPKQRKDKTNRELSAKAEDLLTKRQQAITDGDDAGFAKLTKQIR